MSLCTVNVRATQHTLWPPLKYFGFHGLAQTTVYGGTLLYYKISIFVVQVTLYFRFRHRARKEKKARRKSRQPFNRFVDYIHIKPNNEEQHERKGETEHRETRFLASQ